jgi:hypothetical protein
MAGVLLLSEEEQLKSIQRMVETSSDLSSDIIKAAVQDTGPLSKDWQKISPERSVMDVAMRFFLTETPSGVYVWRNSGSIVMCQFDPTAKHYVLRNLGTSETFTMTRVDGPDMLLTSNKVPGLQGKWTIYHYSSKEKQEEVVEVKEEPKPAPEPVQKRQKTSSSGGGGSKKKLAVPLVEVEKIAPSGEQTV